MCTSRPTLDDRSQHVVGRVQVVADGVPLVPAALHRVRRGALLGEVHQRFRLELLEQIEQPLIVHGDVEVGERDLLSRDLAPRRQPLAHVLDRRERRHLELDVDLAAREIVDDDHLMALGGEVQSSRPAAEAVAAQDQYSHGCPFVVTRCRHPRLRHTGEPLFGPVVLRAINGVFLDPTRRPCPCDFAGRGVEMDSAFLRRVHLPPPAAGARVFSWRDRTRARCAANARVAPVVESVVRDAMRTDVVPHLFGRPLQHRVELVQSVGLVPRLDSEVPPQRRLLPAQASQPCPLADQGAPQGLDLTHAAAPLAQLDSVIESVLAVFRCPSRDLGSLRPDHLDDRTVALVDAVCERVRLLRKATRIDADDVDVQLVSGDEIGHDHALGTEGVGKHSGAVVGGDQPQHPEGLRQHVVHEAELLCTTWPRSAEIICKFTTA